MHDTHTHTHIGRGERERESEIKEEGDPRGRAGVQTAGEGLAGGKAAFVRSRPPQQLPPTRQTSREKIHPAHAEIKGSKMEISVSRSVIEEEAVIHISEGSQLYNRSVAENKTGKLASVIFPPAPPLNSVTRMT